MENKDNTPLINPVIAKLINMVNEAIKKSPTGVTFVQIKNYTNKDGEVQCNTINIGVDYNKAKLKDITYLRNLNVKTLTNPDKIDLTLLEQARIELLTSLLKPEVNRSEGQKEAYQHIIDGIKCHSLTGDLYVYGYRIKKVVIRPITYKVVNKKPLTIAKDYIRTFLKTNKYTQYKLEKIERFNCNKETLDIEL